MAGLRKRPIDGPRQRYRAQLALGLDAQHAASVVAQSYGLSPNIVSLKPDGTKLFKDYGWTIIQVERLLGLKWEAIHGLGGPKDGADKWPHYIDGPVSPP